MGDAVCALQEKLERQRREKMDIRVVKRELMTSLEVLKQCKKNLDAVKAMRPRVFCKFRVHLCGFWDVKWAMQVRQGESVNFKVDNDERVNCCNEFGQKIGEIGKEQKMAMLVLMKEGVFFEGIVGKKQSDFQIGVDIIGYTRSSKQIILEKLKQNGIDLREQTKINFSPSR